VTLAKCFHPFTNKQVSGIRPRQARQAEAAGRDEGYVLFNYLSTEAYNVSREDTGRKKCY